MRLLVIAVLFVAINCCMGQLVLGANGLSLPPINLMTVYKILKRGWTAFMKSMEDKTIEKKENSPRSGDYLTPNMIESAEEDLKKTVQEEMMDQLVEKLNLTCVDESCRNQTSEELLKNSQVTFAGDKLFQLLKEKSESGSITKKEILSVEEKNPSFLPQPLRSGGWIATYLALNGVLLGLYLLLGIPYFATGVTVAEAVDGGADAREDVFSGEYMGYTNYGQSDMMMNYIMDFENEEKRRGGRSSGEDLEDEDEDNRCLEQMLCLKPFYGRALATSHLGVKILEWIPGLKSIGELINQRINRLDTAVESGRQLSCQRYHCNRRK